MLATDFWYLFSIKSYKVAKTRFLGFITRDIGEVGVSRLTWSLWCVLSKISLKISWEWIFEIHLLYFFINDKWWDHHNFTKNRKSQKSPDQAKNWYAFAFDPKYESLKVSDLSGNRLWLYKWFKFNEILKPGQPS